MNTNRPQAQFTRMDQSTREDWQILGNEFRHMAGGLPERVIAHLNLLRGDFGGFQVDRHTHSRQTATRALRDGRDEEYVVCALLHDIGDTLGSYNHADVAGAILQPFVTDENCWMVRHHAIFQGHYFFHHVGLDRDMRDRFRPHPCYDRTAEFCELYDNPAFDPNGEALPITEFVPMLHRLFAQPRNSMYKRAAEGNSSPDVPSRR